MTETPMDQLKRAIYFTRRKHPTWSDKQVLACAKYVVLNPDYNKEKIKQNVCEISKPYQISFEDLMKRGTQYV